MRGIRIHQFGKFVGLVASLVILTFLSGTVWGASVQLTGTNLVPGINWTDYGNERLVSMGNAAPTSAVTVHSVFQINRSIDDPAIDQIWLAALMESSDKPAPVLAFTWQEEKSGFFPTWRLILASKAEVGLPDYGVRPGTGVWDGYSLITLTDTSPEPDHSYAALLSFDSKSGSVSVSLQDVTTGKQVFSGHLQITAGTSPVVPAVSVLEPGGSLAAQAPPVQFTHFAAYPYYVPIAMEWWAEARSPQDTDYVPGWDYNKRDDAVIRLKPATMETRGKYTLTIEHNGLQVFAGVFPTSPLETPFKLPLLDLPLGESQVTLTYLDNQKAIVSDSHPITIGSAEVEVGPITPDTKAHVAHSTVRILSKSDVPDLHLELEARVQQLIWDPVKRAYREEPYQTYVAFAGSIGAVRAEQELVVPISFTIPQTAGLWKIELQPHLQPDLRTSVQSAQKLFSSYAPANPVPGKAFTIAVLPDTQGYTTRYHDILTRQTQWIAENAVERNIALILHMGDITGGNSKPDWEQARLSFGAVQGVVPTVFAIGNHDSLTDVVRSRENTLFEHYFPESDFPAMAGTFAPGRTINSYHLFELGGIKYMILALEYGPRDEVLAWANEVVAAHPSHKVIVITHLYTAPNGLPAFPAPKNENLVTVSTFNDGDSQWRKFASQHKNIVMVVSGHYGSGTIGRSVLKGVNGNPVLGMLFDYQGENNGGNGWLGLLEFSPEGIVTVRTYSPYLDSYKTDIDKWGQNNYFMMDMNTGKVTKL